MFFMCPDVKIDVESSKYIPLTLIRVCLEQIGQRMVWLRKHLFGVSWCISFHFVVGFFSSPLYYK